MRHFPLALVALLLVISFFMITGCAHQPQQVVVREVKVPVRAPCLGPVPEPQTYAGSEVDLESDILGLVIALLVERDQRTITEAQLRAAMKGCV